MSEFIREVDDEYRQEKIRNLLSRYWIFILALAVLVLIGVGSWRGYVYYRQQRNEAAGLRYFDATQKARDDHSGSLAALESLVKDAPAGYRLLARFRVAGELGQEDAVAGTKAFDALAEDQGLGQDLRDIARLKAAMLLMNTAEPAEISRRFEPLADANAPFRGIAREMLAVTALKQGDDTGAKRWLNSIMSDPAAARDQRERAGLFLGLIQSGKPGEAVTAPDSAPEAIRAPVAAPAVSDGSAAAPAPSESASPEPVPEETTPPAPNSGEPDATTPPPPAPASASPDVVVAPPIEAAPGQDVAPKP